MVKVLQTGFFTSVQDLGRFGYQQYGVPYAGVMDERAALIANLLLGNTKNNAVLEFTMTGPKLQFLCTTKICISGGDFQPKLNSIPINNNSVIVVKEDDILSFGAKKSGFRGYIAVLGGFLTDVVMKSRSMFKNVTQHQTIQKNLLLPIKNAVTIEKQSNASLAVNNVYLEEKIITAHKGPEFHKLTIQQQKKLLNAGFTVSKNNSRMAYQLTELLPNTLEPIITSVVLPGTVQLTPSGQLIILMKDCQTTGGYPRVLQLSNTAINILAQKFTGDELVFSLI
ncbi:biotin-dependent carboxyltransferase family protein [Cellulophaga lytica]|uniref:Allophanate hydrolase subunit 2 n=1 Tax=Cellulophaga lytica (strain ATCC 23178 / DSM 7489 / JCM 8516 / NBRC 14961 / NCIMB 1423 / VKM B-1433 / Cy l20) TaxID=867900 RepID=F0RCU4_CELLC|nr:biotin-dependent carboxyltransferase family protein [Cellulophaga lytica]ADY30826.1 Allophanate hydrolase subunit 2 [Cellulophaga lytica DSM 7489]AIM61805.1 allophanate hydrolase [Cellulophaga lytica]WQG78253.1 biotin-dependent carboxyltransferase family protein [Cellulophaga lytica]